MKYLIEGRISRVVIQQGHKLILQIMGDDYSNADGGTYDPPGTGLNQRPTNQMGSSSAQTNGIQMRQRNELATQQSIRDSNIYALPDPEPSPGNFMKVKYY